MAEHCVPGGMVASYVCMHALSAIELTQISKSRLTRFLWHFCEVIKHGSLNYIHQLIILEGRNGAH